MALSLLSLSLSKTNCNRFTQTKTHSHAQNLQSLDYHLGKCDKAISQNYLITNVCQLTAINTLKIPPLACMLSLMTSIASFNFLSPSDLSNVCVVTTYCGGAIRLICGKQQIYWDGLGNYNYVYGQAIS